MKKYYRILQCKWDGDNLLEPIIPITDVGMELMLQTGIATEITKEEAETAKFGSGNFIKMGNDLWKPIAQNWDTSG